ncbi:sulfotransferase family protein [Mycobacterium neumannii]|uniref:sulfotransferase family protein n=1 Tax=Mycobacterium neumannii TaxID=2048551 RepID=UPI003AB56376
MLSLCGATLPSGLVGANSANPLGYWEPRASHRLNFAILRRHGSEWFDPTLRLQENGAFGAEEKTAIISKIRAFLTELPAAPLVVIKDLHVTALSDMWFEAARMTGFDVAAAITVRHPQEVAASLAAFNGSSPELATALWLKANLLAERNTRNVPRVFVEYPNLLDDWRREVKRISTALPIDLTTENEDVIDEFLKPDLHRQRQSGWMKSPFGARWISTVYDTLCEAARDESWDQAVLDHVFEEYRDSEYEFRTAFKDFHRLHKYNWLVRPSAVSLVYEALAIAHRRRGPWA